MAVEWRHLSTAKSAPSERTLRTKWDNHRQARIVCVQCGLGNGTLMRSGDTYIHRARCVGQARAAREM